MDQATTTSRSNGAGNSSKRPSAQQAVDDEKPKELTPQQRFRRKYRHVAATHEVSRESYFTHETSPNLDGFKNLGYIVIAVGNLRLILENMQKYGVLICLRCHDFRTEDVIWGLWLYALIPCQLFVAWLIEYWAAGKARQSRKTASRPGTASPTVAETKNFRSTWLLVAWLHFINVGFAIFITSYAVFYHIHHPLIGTLVEMHAIVVALKTFSFAFTNRDLRHAYLHPVKGELEAMPDIYKTCPYPENINLYNVGYFWWAPTLIYQPAYPRTPSIRWLFVAKRVAEAFGLSVLIWFLTEQYATPTLLNSLKSIELREPLPFLERLFKLSTISLVIWLAGFFALFQSGLNALAEVMRFGDRSFYDDWWNSPSLGIYWRTWNKPVSQFFRRHVYTPLLSRGFGHDWAGVVVFFVSAVLHEMAVGIPTHNIIWVAFGGMMLQVPLIYATTRFEPNGKWGKGKWGKRIGNTVFWVTFTILGQPLAALFYFYFWQAKFGSISRRLVADPVG